MFEKIEKWIFIVFFSLCLLIPLIFVNIKPGGISQTENRVLNHFPSLYDSHDKVNQHFLKEFEAWFNDNLGLRELFFTANARIQYDWFRNSISRNAVIGKENWLFGRWENNIEIGSGTYPNFGNNVIEAIVKQQTEISNLLASQGIDYILTMPPSKVSIYPEFLPGNFSIRETPADKLTKRIFESSDVKMIPIKDVLLEEKSNTDKLLYWPTDTHWNYYGAYIGYSQIIKQLNSWNLLDSQPIQIVYQQAPFTGDLSKNIGNIDEKFKEEEFSDFTSETHNARRITEGALYDSLLKYVIDKGLYNVDNPHLLLYTNNHIDSPTLLLLHDSASLAMLPMLAEHFSTIAAIWDNTISQELIDLVHPDIVINEVAERFSSIHLDGYANKFLEGNIWRERNILFISYCDFGDYPEMQFMIKSKEKEEKELLSVPAKRTDQWTWQAQVDLNDLEPENNYKIYFYLKTEESSLELISKKTYHIDS